MENEIKELIGWVRLLLGILAGLSLVEVLMIALTIRKFAQAKKEADKLREIHQGYQARRNAGAVL